MQGVGALPADAVPIAQGAAAGLFRPFVQGGDAAPANAQPVEPAPDSAKIVGKNSQPAANPMAVAPTTMAAVPPASSLLPDPTPLVMGIVYTSDAGTEICSGTLVDATHVLTAGHCACGAPTSYRIYPTNSVYPDGMTTFKQAGLGTTYYESKPPVMFDPRLCGGGRFAGNDLALLELASGISLAAPPMNFGDPLWQLLHGELSKGQKLEVMGYGYNNLNLIGFRYKDAIPIFSIACTEPVLAPYCTPYAEMILAEAPGPGKGDDSCGGDSGGPVFQMTNFGYALLAVTSRSAPGLQSNPEKNCGGGGIYTLLGRDSVQQWLQANGVRAASWTTAANP
jgi:hypothetical protein